MEPLISKKCHNNIPTIFKNFFSHNFSLNFFNKKFFLFFIILLLPFLFSSCTEYSILSEAQKNELRNETTNTLRTLFTDGFLNCHENSIQWGLECLEDLDQNRIPDRFYKKENILQSYLHYGQREGLPELWGNLKQFILDNKIINYYGDLETYTDIVDTDGDRIPDVVELSGALRYITNPYFYDTDWDGLGDLDEILWGTNPVTSDSNWDGIWDGSSVINKIAYPYSKEVITASGADADGDGIPNAAEQFYLGTDPNTYSSDGDRYGDGQEYFGIDSKDERLPPYVPHDPFTPAAPELEIYVSDLLDIYVPKKEISRQVIQKSSIEESIKSSQNTEKTDGELYAGLEIGSRVELEATASWNTNANNAGYGIKVTSKTHLEANAGASFKYNQIASTSEQNNKNNKEAFDDIFEKLETTEFVEFRYILTIKNVGNDILEGPLQDILFSVKSLDDEFPFFSSVPTALSEVQYNNILPGNEIKVIIPIKVDYDHFEKFRNGIGIQLSIDFFSYGKDQIYVNNVKSRNVELVLIDGNNNKVREYIPVKRNQQLSLKQILDEKNIPYDIVRDSEENVIVNNISNLKSQKTLPQSFINIKVSNNLENFDVKKKKDYEDLGNLKFLNYLFQDVSGGCPLEFTSYFDGRISSEKMDGGKYEFDGFKFFPPAGDENNLGEINPRYIEFPRFFQYYGAQSKQTSLDKYFIGGLYGFESEISSEIREGKFSKYFENKEKADFLIFVIDPAVSDFDEIFHYLEDMIFTISNGETTFEFSGEDFVENYLSGDNQVFKVYIPGLSEFREENGKGFFEMGYGDSNYIDFTIRQEKDCDFESTLNYGESNAFLFGAGDKITLSEKIDADGDGLIFEEELALGTNFNLKDTDGDGLTDGYTNALLGSIGELSLNSNPLKTDTDGDGYDDFLEYTEGTNLSDNTSFPNIDVVSRITFFSSPDGSNSFKTHINLNDSNLFSNLSTYVNYEVNAFKIPETYLAEIYTGTNFGGDKKILAGGSFYNIREYNKTNSIKVFKKDHYLSNVLNKEGYYIIYGADKEVLLTHNNSDNLRIYIGDNDLESVYVSEGCYLQLFQSKDDQEKYDRGFGLLGVLNYKDRGYRVALNEGYWTFPSKFGKLKASKFYCDEKEVVGLISDVEEPFNIWHKTNFIKSNIINGESIFISKGEETCELIGTHAGDSYFEGNGALNTPYTGSGDLRLDDQCFAKFTGVQNTFRGKIPIKYAELYSDDHYLEVFGEKFYPNLNKISEANFRLLEKKLSKIPAARFTWRPFGITSALNKLTDAHVQYRNVEFNGKSLLSHPESMFTGVELYNIIKKTRSTFQVNIINNVNDFFNDIERNQFTYKKVSKIFPKKGTYIFKNDSAFDKVYFIDKTKHSPFIISTYEDPEALYDKNNEDGLMFAAKSEVPSIFNYKYKNYAPELYHGALKPTGYNYHYGVVNDYVSGRIEIDFVGKIKNYFLPHGKKVSFYLKKNYQSDFIDITDTNENVFIEFPLVLKNALSYKVINSSNDFQNELALLIESPINNKNYTGEYQILIDFQGKGDDLYNLYYDIGNGKINYSYPIYINPLNVINNKITFYAEDTNGKIISKEINYIYEIENEITINPPTPNNNSYLNSKSQTINFTIIKNNTYKVNLEFDGTNITLTNSSNTYTYTNNFLSEGLHNFTIYINDEAGNQNQIKRSFTIDTISPKITINPPTPNNNSIINKNYIYFNLSINDSNLNKTYLIYDNNLINNSFSKKKNIRCNKSTTNNINKFPNFN